VFEAFNVARRMRDNGAMENTMKRTMWLLEDSFRALVRDWRAGELRLLLVAVVIAVAALSSVGLFADRLRIGLQTQALQMLGADLVVSADNPIDPALVASAKARGLKAVSILSFPSMVQSADQAQIPQLAGIKAVEAGYPLRGAVSIIEQEGAEPVLAKGVPEAGTVWIDSALGVALGVRLKSAVQLGERQFVVAAYIAIEPDRGTNFMSLAPRLMLNAQDLASTQLLQAGSRISYRLQIAGGTAPLAEFKKNAQLARGQRFESLEGGRPELRTTLDRAEKFLSLVSLITALIAACALAMGAQRYAARHLDAFAVQRALGAQHRSLVLRTGLELLWIAIAGGVLGALLGFAAQQVLVELLGGLLRMRLPMPGWLPYWGFRCCQLCVWPALALCKYFAET
jgi:putative ABC transport system permease protein